MQRMGKNSNVYGFEAIDFNLEYETKSNAFQWDDRPEREQKDRYSPRRKEWRTHFQTVCINLNFKMQNFLFI